MEFNAENSHGEQRDLYYEQVRLRKNLTMHLNKSTPPSSEVRWVLLHVVHIDWYDCMHDNVAMQLLAFKKLFQRGA